MTPPDACAAQARSTSCANCDAGSPGKATLILPRDERADKLNKGGDAARAALTMMRIKKRLAKPL